MKKYLLFILLLSSSFVALYAQSEKYTAAMKKNIELLDSAKTGDDFQNVSNNFERIAGAEKTQWLPNYYAAHCLILKAYSEKDKTKIDPVLDKADAFLATADSLSKDNSEITTLKSMSTSARLQVDFMRGMTLGPKSSQLAKLAETRAPANPRPLIMEAQNLYFTPEAFGGSKAKGKEVIKKAVELFAAFKPESAISPNWGKEYAEKLLADWSK